MNKTSQNYLQRGFTLIELLVTLAIITVLLSLSLVAINSARIRSRDAKRIADLRTIQAALEQHVLGDASHTYPPDSTILNDDNKTYCTKYDPSTPGSNKGLYDNKCFTDYLSVVPKGTDDQPYTYVRPGCGTASNADPSGVAVTNDIQSPSCIFKSTSYVLHVKLESDKNQDASQDASPNYPLSYDLIP